MKPILFNTEMVRAILEGRKTCTRRVVKPQPTNTDYCQHDMVTFDRMLPDYYRGDYSCACRKCGYGVMPNGKSAFKPPYKPGDILYVRETWQYACDLDGNEQIIEGTERYLYAADGEPPFDNWIMPDGTYRDHMPWRPSIHMPREAARIFLRVTDVRVERLQDCGNMQAKDEGCSCCSHFARIWDETIKPSDRDTYGWDANPWVWVIEFERCEKPEEARHEKV